MSLRRTSEASGRPRTMMRPNSAGSLSRPPPTTGDVRGVPGHQEDGRLALRRRDPVAHALLGQLRLGERDLVLHVHRREVRVARDVEIDRQVHDAGARVRRLEIEQPVEPRELLLDRRGHGCRDVLRRGARVHGLHLDLGRRKRRVTVHRERAEREQPQQHDDDRDDAREDRAPDEDVANLRRVAHGVLRAALLSAAGWYATARTGDPGATCWTPSTTTRSPAASPCAISHDPPSHAVAITSRVATLSPASSTYTNAPPSPCCTARCGTRMAPGCCKPSSRTRTNCPGSKRCCGFSSSARSSCVPVAGCSARSVKFSVPVSGYTVPAASVTCTASGPLGITSRPSFTSRRQRSTSWSEGLKFT